MTAEGIIQKLFAGYIDASEEGHLYKQLQQDLIAEIKKIPIEDYFEHYQPHHHSCSSNCNLSIIRTLIGEQEK